jgi:hypothetical protein
LAAVDVQLDSETLARIDEIAPPELARAAALVG